MISKNTTKIKEKKYHKFKVLFFINQKLRNIVIYVNLAQIVYQSKQFITYIDQILSYFFIMFINFVILYITKENCIFIVNFHYFR